MLLGGQFGAGAILSGLIQGIGSELGFTFTGYRHYDKLALFCRPSLAPSLPSAGACPRRLCRLPSKLFNRFVYRSVYFNWFLLWRFSCLDQPAGRAFGHYAAEVGIQLWKKSQLTI